MRKIVRPQFGNNLKKEKALLRPKPQRAGLDKKWLRIRLAKRGADPFSQKSELNNISHL